MLFSQHIIRRIACAGVLITLVLAVASAPATNAQHRSDSMNRGRDGAEMKPTGIPVDLPSDPTEKCAAKVQRKATYCSERYDFYRGESLDDKEQELECCQLMAAYFGTNATENNGHGANCFCVKTVWEETLEREETSQTDYASAFDTCTKLGHPILYYQDGKGPCTGLAPEEGNKKRGQRGGGGRGDEDEAQQPGSLPPVKTFGGWLRSLPADNPVLIVAILISIPSVAGFSTVVLWPLTYFSVLEGMRWSRWARSLWTLRKAAP